MYKKKINKIEPNKKFGEGYNLFQVRYQLINVDMSIDRGNLTQRCKISGYSCFIPKKNV